MRTHYFLSSYVLLLFHRSSSPIGLSSQLPGYTHKYWNIFTLLWSSWQTLSCSLHNTLHLQHTQYKIHNTRYNDILYTVGVFFFFFFFFFFFSCISDQRINWVVPQQIAYTNGETFSLYTNVSAYILLYCSPRLADRGGIILYRRLTSIIELHKMHEFTRVYQCV